MEKIRESIRDFLKKNLSPNRFRHSLGVEKMSLLLASKFSCSPVKCGIAGLAHDICREMSGDQLISYTGLFHTNPLLLHGHAGARKLREVFLIDDKSILDAVKYHISGTPELDDIGKIVFAADFMEEGRSHLNDQERRRLFLLGLDDMVLDIAGQIFRYLYVSGCEIDPQLNLFIDKLYKGKLSES